MVSEIISESRARSKSVLPGEIIGIRKRTRVALMPTNIDDVPPAKITFADMRDMGVRGLLLGLQVAT